MGVGSSSGEGTRWMQQVRRRTKPRGTSERPGGKGRRRAGRTGPGSGSLPASPDGILPSSSSSSCVPLGLVGCSSTGKRATSMKLLLALAVLIFVSAQAFAEELGDHDELSYWSDWSDGDQNKEELPLPFEHFLQRIARRPRPQQFYGLMGKRDAGYGPLSHKRHKTDSFVGLMGKRSLNSGSSEWNTAQMYERRRK
ncbi:protachykinin-1 isoform X2 [Hemicordylus capensis]|uniref:protachykinin-1 isoform X2 n=2 Tax=Hemicordylus capensis TaxID=884348 RepID=UPI002303ECB6|nr:protachykinin-1 isoform X2 [Hemicordylus capensis]